MAKLKFLNTARLVLLASAAIPSFALAQTTESEGVSNEVVVTATRRAVSVQDVPVNISAVGAQAIEEQGFAELSDVTDYIPGISVIDQGPRSGNAIVVRGLNADPIGSEEGLGNGGGGTVATYVGEIPVYIDLKLNDLERVEVLLGPQGTLYGAGTLSGAIRYIPRRPQFDTYELQVRGNAYSYSEADDISTSYGFTANAGWDTFAIRVSLDRLEDTGFIDYPFVVREIGVSEPDPDFSDPAARAANFNPVADANGEAAWSGRIGLRAQPAPWLDASLTYYFQEQEIEGRTVSSARSTVPAGPYEAGLRVLEPNDRDNQLFALEVTADLGFAELTSASGIGRYSEVGQRDQTDLLISLEYSYEAFPTFTAFTREQQEDEFFNQELRLVSTHGGPINWIIGAYYNRFESVGTSEEYTPGYGAFAGFSRPDDLEYFSIGSQRLTETAFFGEVGYDITDRWTVTVGARRYDYELQEFSSVDFPYFDPGFTLPLFETIDDIPYDPDLGQSDSGWLYKFNTSYEFSDNILAYLTISEGYRIGNSNGLAECTPFVPGQSQNACAFPPGVQFGPNPGDITELDETQYGPDQTLNYEVGVKSTLFDGRLQLNGAVYFVEWTDPQVSSATINGNIPITVNAAGAESMGAEISADAQVTDAWRLRGSYAYNTNELTAVVPSLIRTITPPGFGTAFIDGQVGDRLPGSPEHQFSVFSSYTWALGSGADLVFNASYAYQSDVLSRAGGRGDSLTLDGFGIADASVSYQTEAWSITAYADNVFDEYAETGVRGTALSNQTINGANVRTFYTNVAPPRALGVRFNYRFGG